MSAAYLCEGQARLSPFSLRFTVEERQTLESLAGTMPLGSYIKSRLFADGAPPKLARTRNPVRDDRALAQVLARLGESRMASNLNQLAHAANIGALDCDDEVAAALTAACADIRAMRSMLMTALGLRSAEPTPIPTPPRQAFSAASDADQRP
jgi:hypothetical protein